MGLKEMFKRRARKYELNHLFVEDNCYVIYKAALDGMEAFECSFFPDVEKRYEFENMLVEFVDCLVEKGVIIPKERTEDDYKWIQKAVRKHNRSVEREQRAKP
jgi:hypothetical protein